MTGPLNAGEAAVTGSGVTVIEGGTFCLSDATGDVTPGVAQGLFHQDARVLSRLELRLDGQPLEGLSVQQQDAFAARFVLRQAPKLLVVRERLVNDGMRDTVTVDNFGREPVTIRLDLHVAADFADLFAVKHGDTTVSTEGTVGKGQLVLPGQVSVSATGAPAVTPGLLSWTTTIPPRGRWSTEITVRTAEPFDGTGPTRRLEAWRDHHPHRHRSEARGGVAPHQERPRRVAGRRPAALRRRRGALVHDAVRPRQPADRVDGAAAGRRPSRSARCSTLAESQGTIVDRRTEEEPGRIMHELRRGPGSAAALGGTHYYGTVDATPLFVMLLAESWRWGADDDAVRALLPAADAALAWVDSHGDRDGDGFVEYAARHRPRPAATRAGRTAPTAINDAAGQMPTGPIALCEVQGYVYAALLARAELAETFGEDADRPAAHGPRRCEQRFAERVLAARPRLVRRRARRRQATRSTR